MLAVYFSDFFGVPIKKISDYGAFNISLIEDLPLFVDPFLLFNSERPEYQKLHNDIIEYVSYLKRNSDDVIIKNPGLLKAWYFFPEVKQNWFGFTKDGNSGKGLGRKFATSLVVGFSTVLSNLGNETVTGGSHLEKLTLIKSGVGKDNISDFTTNLIKGYLAKYTQEFAVKNIDRRYLKSFPVAHSSFNYKTGSWRTETFVLPAHNDDYVLLTPRDLLTRDNTWISRADLNDEWYVISRSIDNDALRDQINYYFDRVLPKDPTREQFDQAVSKVIATFPVILDYYLRYKERGGDEAIRKSATAVSESERLFVFEVTKLVRLLEDQTLFYSTGKSTLADCRERVQYLKHVIEDKDGYRFFWKDGKSIQREDDIHILFKLTWFATDKDVNAEVNNGRGPADFKVSLGAKDASIVEFKLASNKQLKSNLEYQTEIYKKASDAKKSISVIIYFSQSELERVLKILKELGIKESADLVLIDGRKDNKISASKVK